jgi:hypothetical protein
VLGTTVAANGVLLYEANKGDSMGIESDYYRKAVAWDSTLAQALTNQRLGWQVEGTFDPPRQGRSMLHITAADRNGAPIVGAEARVEGFAIAHAHSEIEAAMTGTGPGRFELEVPVARVELHEFRLQLSRGSERFTATLRCTSGEACR